MSDTLIKNLQQLKSGLPDNVSLVAISKTKPTEMIREVYAAGQRDFGENRIQEMAQKYEELPRDIRWHMVGHVQGNKIKYMAHFVHLVHGMDKPKRFKELNKEARKNDKVIDCLMQIHIAREESKFGFDYDEAREFMAQDLPKLYPNLRLRGLMGMATFTDREEIIREEFRGLAEFYREMRGKHEQAFFDILSMGMSGDFRIALEEGSNMIRVGQAIFGARE